MQNPLASMKPYHTALSVANLDKTAQWYQEKLGFKMVKNKEFPEFSTRVAFLELNTYKIELIEDKNSVPINPPRLNPPQHSLVQGILQFSFLVDDLDATAALLKSRGVEFAWDTRTDEDWGGKFFWVKDNNGNLIQFFQKLNQTS